MKIEIDGPSGDKFLFGMFIVFAWVMVQFCIIKIQSATIENYKNIANHKSWIYDQEAEKKSNVTGGLGYGWMIESREDGTLSFLYNFEPIVTINAKTGYTYKIPNAAKISYPTYPTTGVYLYSNISDTGNINCVDYSGLKYRLITK